jgi:predicted DNA-binding transcriptional regulator AlpA
MTYDAVQNTLLNPPAAEVDAPQGQYIFHGFSPRKGWAQLTMDEQHYWGVGEVEVCGEDRRPLADQQAHVVPGYQHDEAKDEVIVCQDMKNERWYRFTGTLRPFSPKARPTAAKHQAMPAPAEAPEPAPQSPMLKAQARRAAKRPVSETYGQDLQRIRQSLDAGLDPDVRIDFIAEYVSESRANLYRKMKLTPPQFPHPIKRGNGSFWPFSLVEAYRKGEWKPLPATSKEASS